MQGCDGNASPADVEPESAIDQKPVVNLPAAPQGGPSADR